MAPIKTNTVGISPQILDDLKLQQLMDALNNVRVKSGNDISLDEISRLVQIVREYPTWNFEEQVRYLVRHVMQEMIWVSQFSLIGRFDRLDTIVEFN